MRGRDRNDILALFQVARSPELITSAALVVINPGWSQLRPAEIAAMIRKLPSGKYRLYSRKKDPKTGRRRNLGTFDSRNAAERHERAVQYFKRH
jgi:hypothetical protein